MGMVAACFKIRVRRLLCRVHFCREAAEQLVCGGCVALSHADGGDGGHEHVPRDEGGHEVNERADSGQRQVRRTGAPY